jgi:flagellar motility protein MotE (MotC chaperone)
MVGLERRRQEFEIGSAKREVTLGVREENLKADRERFEQQMKFTEERFDAEVKYLKDLMGEILKRLPNVEVNKTLEVVDGTRRRTASA